MLKTVPMSALRVGAVLASPIFDQQRTKLLAPDIPITAGWLDKLRIRGVSSVIVDERDLARLSAYQPQGTSSTSLPGRSGVRSPAHPAFRRQLDALLSAEASWRLEPQGEPFARNIEPHGTQPYDRQWMNRLVEEHEQRVERLDGCFSHLAAGEGADLEALEAVSREALLRAAADLDLFVCLGINPYSGGYPGRHSLHAAMLAMSIGATLELDEQTLVELGVGCLVHDLGMLCVGPAVFGARRILGPAEFIPITEHPAATLDLIERHLDALPAASRIVAYQMHERCDGSGYPDGRMGNQIHPLARIAAVADAYTALVSSRPHRPGMLPYYALVKILQDVQYGLFDPTVVRGLLKTVSLFPIGSFLLLSDGQIGKVIRSNRHAYDRPVIEAWSKGVDEAAVIDLSAQRSLKPMRALPASC